MPLLQTVYPVLPPLVQEVDEHRSPAPLPVPGLLLDEKGGFAAALNKWFDDRMGFRDLFIRTKNQIDYSLFGTSRKVYVGTDGWLFERITTDEQLKFDQLSSTELRVYKDAFKSVADQLRQRGVQLVVVRYPGKATLYPEFLPSSLRGIVTDRNYDELNRFMASQKGIIFIDAGAILKQEKAATGKHLYYKTDLHVNLAGTIAVVKSIVERIAEAEGRPEIRWHENLDMATADWNAGADARFLALLKPISERNPYARAGYTVGQAESDGKWTVGELRPANQLAAGEIPSFMFEFHPTPDLCFNRLPGMVLYGNSFSNNYWNVGLHRYFCFTRRAYQMINRLPAVVGTLPPGTKYVIYQYYDPYLPGSAPLPQ